MDPAAAPWRGYSFFSTRSVPPDAREAVRAAAQRLAARQAVVIGGGVLGVEAAEALQHPGLRVTLPHRGERPMDRQLAAEGARRLAGDLAETGQPGPSCRWPVPVDHA